MENSNSIPLCLDIADCHCPRFNRAVMEWVDKAKAQMSNALTFGQFNRFYAALENKNKIMESIL